MLWGELKAKAATDMGDLIYAVKNTKVDVKAKMEKGHVVAA